MTSPRKSDNLWSDLAASVVQQVADRVRKMNDSYSGPSATQYRDGDPATSWTHTTSSHTSVSWQVDAAGAEPNPDAPGPRQSAASLASELGRLMSTGFRVSAQQAKQYKDLIQQQAAERERKRIEAPMRRAQRSARRNKAGAIALGVLAVGGVAGTASTAMDDKAPAAVSTGIVTVGMGAGTFALGRRSRQFSRLADEEAQRLGAASAQAVSLRGASAYSVPLPDRASLAYQPTLRLLEQKKALAALLPDVEDVAPELAPLAQESEAALADYAERVIKLERAQAAAGGTASLDAALARAVAQYEEGVEAHQKLVEAAATVMAELVDGHGDSARYSMGDAADRLQGLAEGLRQVRNDIPMNPPTPEWGAQPDPAAPAPAAARRPNRRRDPAG